MPPIETDIHYTFFTALTVLTLLLGVFAFSIFRHLRKKKRQMKDRSFREEKAIERDRKRIAFDLHDDFGSELTGLKFSLRELADKDPTNKALSQTASIIERSLSRLREISLNLTPREIECEGLHGAVEALMDRINETSRIAIQYSGELFSNLETSRAIIVFRVLQEILANAIRHSQAARINLAILEKGNNLIMELKDDGLGFDYEQALVKPNSSGLKNIQARLDMLNAVLVIESAKETGTHYFITIPMKHLVQHGNNH